MKRKDSDSKQQRNNAGVNPGAGSGERWKELVDRRIMMHIDVTLNLSSGYKIMHIVSTPNNTLLGSGLFGQLGHFVIHQSDSSSLRT